MKFLQILHSCVTSTSVRPTWWPSHEIRSGEKLRFDSRSQIKFYSDLQKILVRFWTCLETHQILICERCVWDVTLSISEWTGTCIRFCVWKIWRVGGCPSSLPDWECARGVWEIGLSTRSAEGATDDAKWGMERSYWTRECVPYGLNVCYALKLNSLLLTDSFIIFKIIFTQE